MPSIRADVNGKQYTISYPVREALQVITAAEAALITTIDTVPAIKFIRDQYGLGLYESKQLVDTARAYMHSASTKQG